MRLADIVRRAWRSFMRWRTVNLLEQIDADAEALCDLRDHDIPRAIRALAEEKHALLQQLVALAEPGELHPLTTAVPRPATSGGWSPSTPGRTGPLFQQRTRNQ